MMLLMVSFPILLIIHFVPSFIARKRPDFFIILLVNILTGWSIIGWLAALYLALRKVPVVGPVAQHSVADELAKLRDLRNQGVITAEEFERQKHLILN